MITKKKNKIKLSFKKISYDDIDNYPFPGKETTLGQSLLSLLEKNFIDAYWDESKQCLKFLAKETQEGMDDIANQILTFLRRNKDFVYDLYELCSKLNVNFEELIPRLDYLVENEYIKHKFIKGIHYYVIKEE